MLFVIDFDGTLALKDTVDTLLGQFSPATWKDVEQDWLQGRITAVECMGRQIRMIRADRPTLEDFFRSTELDASFLPFYHHVIRYAKVAIVSDGLDYPIQVAIRKAGLPNIPVFANRMDFVANGIDISFPHLDALCAVGNGVCKCAVARDLAQPLGGPVVLVGDGKSDACLAHWADVVFAKKSLLRYCEEQGIAHIPFDSFADVLAVVEKWGAYPPRKLSLVA
jgi:2,3-diketo-5-methylthio-1-phosphopentane phosphatase